MDRFSVVLSDNDCRISICGAHIQTEYSLMFGCVIDSGQQKHQVTALHNVEALASPVLLVEIRTVEMFSFLLK